MDQKTMTDADFLRALADDFGVAAAWGEHAATCKRLREIAGRLECAHLFVAPAGSEIGAGFCAFCGAKEPENRDDD